MFGMIPIGIFATLFGYDIWHVLFLQAVYCGVWQIGALISARRQYRQAVKDRMNGWRD